MHFVQVQLQSSVPLRDDRVVGRCLLGMCDGRRLILQVQLKASFMSTINRRVYYLV